LGVVPILTVPAANAVCAQPPAVKVTEAGRNDGEIVPVPDPASRLLVAMLAEKVTVPAKLPRLHRFRVAAAEPPLGTLSTVGDAVMLKSLGWTTTESVEPPVIASA
jgi:hypothetical protein